MEGRAPIPTQFVAAAVAVSGLAALAATFRPPDADLNWMYAVAAALVGLTLWSLTHRPTARRPLFGDVTARIRSPRRRAAARLLVLATAPLAGAGVIAYAVASACVTFTAAPTESRPVDWRVSVGTGLIGLACVEAAVAAGVSLGTDGLLWSALLIGSGLALFWGAAGTQPIGDRHSAFEHARLRTQLGLLLVLVGAGVVLDRTGAFWLDARTAVGVAAVIGIGALVIGPRWWRNLGLLVAERRLRAREQERAEIGEMLHDSVLQTLALIQRRTDVPDQVATLARRQERELRDWLLRGERSNRVLATLDEALRGAIAEVEDDHGVAIEAVIVGDVPLSPRIEALLAAAREALVNAAKHGGGAPISLFAKVESDAVSVYVHDRGPGFDAAAVDPARRGVRDSLLGRMRRVGGTAEIRTAPGAGCEVVLIVKGDG